MSSEPYGKTEAFAAMVLVLGIVFAVAVVGTDIAVRWATNWP